MSKYQIMRERVRTMLSRKIQNGELLPGDKLTELAVCAELEISRTPAREALLQLSSEGVLDYTPRRGFTVKNIPAEKKLEVYAVIEVLDALAAKLAASGADDVMTREMMECADMIDVAIKYRNYQNYYGLQRRFHDIYRGRCGNSVLQKNLADLLDGFVSHVGYHLDAPAENVFEALRELNDEHKHIVRLFENRDGERLFDFLMNVHWKVKYGDLL
jgi:DNA-binding GntR family transcriptional regulator